MLRSKSATQMDTQKTEKNVNERVNAAVRKMISKLPENVRLTVASLVDMAHIASEDARRLAEASAMELLTLRAEVRKKSIEIEQLQRSCEIFQDRIRVSDEKVKMLESSIVSKEKFTTQNKQDISKLSSTNKVQTFNSLIRNQNVEKSLICIY